MPGNAAAGLKQKTAEVEDRDGRRYGDGRSLRTTVRVTVWVLERTKLRRSDRPQRPMKKIEFRREREKNADHGVRVLAWRYFGSRPIQMNERGVRIGRWRGK